MHYAAGYPEHVPVQEKNKMWFLQVMGPTDNIYYEFLEGGKRVQILFKETWF